LKQIEKEAKRAEIMNIARVMFSEKGFDNTSMEEIAKKVKIAKGTIYLYFESKYTLFLEIISFAHHNMFEKTKKIYEKKIPNLEKLREMIKIYIDFTTEYPEYLMLFHSIHHQMNPKDRERLIETMHNEKIKDGNSLISSIIRNGIECGEFRKDLDEAVETFRFYSIFISFGVAFNVALRDTHYTPNIGDYAKRKEIIWDTLDRVLNTLVNH